MSARVPFDRHNMTDCGWTRPVGRYIACKGPRGLLRSRWGTICGLHSPRVTPDNFVMTFLMGHLVTAPDLDLDLVTLIALSPNRISERMPSHRRSNLSQRSNSSRVEHAYRLRETRGQNIRRLRAQSARQAAVRSLETPDPIHSRLQAHSEIYSSTRRNTRTNNFFSCVWSSM
ncbi:hypothetical protein LAZ67_2001567 [Cordylochernes scorpioides]|uniref:Uncharacterized protein n=1 Tax=Cordylochernes scorpioides TaxID=51811 RepID=A0ABY6K4I6_9ARAC|nr:hypothetical protein LAZ67_2001567 [Cordylochernes scorpioides]